MYCIICGKPITTKQRIKINRVASQGYSRKSFVYNAYVCASEWCIEKYTQFRENGVESFDGFCTVCGKQFKVILGRYSYYPPKYKHAECVLHKKPLRKTPVAVEKKTHRTYLKPWQDPESLFCDTEFLDELVGKEVARGDECKG